MPWASGCASTRDQRHGDQEREHRVLRPARGRGEAVSSLCFERALVEVSAGRGATSYYDLPHVTPKGHPWELPGSRWRAASDAGEKWRPRTRRSRDPTALETDCLSLATVVTNPI